jgi:hypothetical protein
MAKCMIFHSVTTLHTLTAVGHRPVQVALTFTSVKSLQMRVRIVYSLDNVCSTPILELYDISEALVSNFVLNCCGYLSRQDQILC